MGEIKQLKLDKELDLCPRCNRPFVVFGVDEEGTLHLWPPSPKECCRGAFDDLRRHIRENPGWLPAGVELREVD